MATEESSHSYERDILAHFTTGQMLSAIKVCGTYERALLSNYGNAAFKDGTLDYPAGHMKMQTVFSDWRRVDANELEFAKEAALLGIETLVVLKGTNNTDRFIVWSTNVGIQTETSGTGFGGFDDFSDLKMKLMLESLALGLGRVGKTQIKQIRQHRVVMANTDLDVSEGVLVLVGLGNEGRFYYFLLSSSSATRDKNEQLLLEAVGGIDFEERKEQIAQIRSIRKKHGASREISSLLKCAGELASIGQYNAAAAELAKVRALCVETMPQPVLSGNVVQDEVYGLKISKPDEQEWTLKVLEEGPFRGVLLEEKSMEVGSGILFVVMDPVVLHGPEVARVLKERTSEDEYLAAVCEESVRHVGRLGRFGFTAFDDKKAYDAVLEMDTPGMKARMLGWQEEGFVMIVLMALEDDRFETRIREYEDIVRECLTIEQESASSIDD